MGNRTKPEQLDSLLLRLAAKTEFRLWCCWCVQSVPIERAARGADTCSTGCQRNKRKASRRFQKLLNLERLLASPQMRRRIREAERTAPPHQNEAPR
jgi:hypothetical protein